MSAGNAPTQASVWYFVGATFAFASTSLFFSEPELLWLRIVMMVLGFGLVVAGGVLLGREMTEQCSARRGPPEPPR